MFSCTVDSALAHLLMGMHGASAWVAPVPPRSAQRRCEHDTCFANASLGAANAARAADRVRGAADPCSIDDARAADVADAAAEPSAAGAPRACADDLAALF